MKKVFDQTVRDIKREVNKKVLKVPGIEQKVLDATSNEPWGPHGSLLADIAQATRNYHEYQMIMTVIWKRINDTGRNWRHVYKALTVLDYLVAHGAERVIDEIREHAYQISTLSNFQYIDSSGRDQGNNVRKKSQSLVQLVNDKERIIEVRQKAAANREKFRSTSMGGMYRPGSTYGDRYDDDRYGSRDDDRNGYGYGREREWGYRDDDRSSNGRDYEERYSRDGYKDDDYRGRSQTVDDYQYGSRSRSSDRGRYRNYDDDGQHSSRGSNAKAEDRSLEARLEQKLSEQNLGRPPSYEEAVGEVRSPVNSERDGEASAVSAPRGSSSTNDNPSEVPAPKESSPPVNSNATQVPPAATSRSENQAIETFDEFDPRGPAEAVLATSDNHEMDLLGSLSESFSSNALALVPATSETTTSEANDHTSSNSADTFTMALSASNNVNQPFGDPFGDSPFKAIPSAETAPSHPQMYQSTEPHQSGSEFSSQGLSTAQQETDILADILPPAPLPAMASHENVTVVAAQPTNQFLQQGFSAATNQPTQQAFSVPGGQIVPFSASSDQSVQQPFSAPTGQPLQQPFSAPNSHPANQPFSANTVQPAQQPFSVHTGQPAQQPFSSPTSQPAHNTFPYPTDPAMQSFSAHGGQPAQSTGNIYGGYHSQSGSLTTGAPSVSPQSQNGGMFLPPGSIAPPSHMASQTPAGQLAQSGNYFPRPGGSITRTTSDMAAQSPIPTGQLAQSGNYFPRQAGSINRTTSDMSSLSSTSHASQFNGGNVVAQQGTATPFSLVSQSGANASNASQYAVSSSTGSNSLVPQPSKEKFETKSTVWADTLSRGLVNLNISGPKINPLADIGIDFDAINRKEKRMEKPTTATSTTVISTVNMGKAMGSGSGIGRAGASALRAPSNPMMGQGMNMGMGMGNNPGVGMGMGGYGGMNPSLGMGMSLNMGRGMGQGVQMQQPTGFPPGSNVPGNYNPMMGAGGYSQQPYGGY